MDERKVKINMGFVLLFIHNKIGRISRIGMAKVANDYSTKTLDPSTYLSRDRTPVALYEIRI